MIKYESKLFSILFLLFFLMINNCLYLRLHKTCILLFVYHRNSQTKYQYMLTQTKLNYLLSLFGNSEYKTQYWSDYTEASVPCGWQLGPVGRLPSGDPVTSWFGAAWVGHWWLWSTAGACWRRWSSGHSGDCWPGKPQSTDQNNACREKSYKMITVIQYYVLM